MTGSLWIVRWRATPWRAILLFAASAKLVAPDLLGRSLLRLTDRPALAARAPVRAIGMVELVLALGLLVEPLRQLAGGLVLVLGLAFIAAGIAGRIRKVDEPSAASVRFPSNRWAIRTSCSACWSACWVR